MNNINNLTTSRANRGCLKRKPTVLIFIFLYNFFIFFMQKGEKKMIKKKLFVTKIINFVKIYFYGKTNI